MSPVVPERVDLDALQRIPVVAADDDTVAALVAELRELREQRDDLARRLADMAIRYANLLADQAGEP